MEEGARSGLDLCCDTAATALWLLDVPCLAALDGRPVTSAFE
jgi:hypothetical protein